MLRFTFALLAGCLFLAARGGGAENPANQASEHVPPQSVQGTSADSGPMHLFDKKESSAAKESKVVKKSDEDQNAKPEKKDKKAHEKKKEEREASKEEAAAAEKPAAEPAVERPAAAQEETKAPVDEAAIRFAIRRLGMSGWREAQAQLLEAGKAAVPFLMDAMGDDGQTAPIAAYNLGGHIKADTGRATRQRPLSEICAEVLTDIITTRTNYRGELPALDQKGWRDWWAANSASITFAR